MQAAAAANRAKSGAKQGLARDKMTVYQQCLAGFNGKISPRRARVLLTQVLLLVSAGEPWPPEEATELFFSVSKLFQHPEPSLRQIVYLTIKELAHSANDVIMMTSSIMKDIQGPPTIFKPNAIRALVRIIDPSLIQNVERILKTSIADKAPSTSAAALVSAYHLAPVAMEIVRRWANEASEAIATQKVFQLTGKAANPYASGSAYMYQYHAVGLLYLLRSHDKMALMKLIQKLSGANSKVRNSNAVVMVIRYIKIVIQQDNKSKDSMYKILLDLLKHKSDMVNLEAAKTILNGDFTEAQALPVVSVLQTFLASPRTVSRFAAIRLLNAHAGKCPANVAVCNLELESLISDPSRAIATYAITTLLKTGNEQSVDRLMAHISGFMSEISDDFKVTVIEAIRTLALKFPAKHEAMLKFLAGSLREDGGVAFKTAIVDALFDMVREISDCKAGALDALCEFLEDCEFGELSIRALHILGCEGPQTLAPTKYIRYVYNRVVLENPVVRAAAVSALAKFGVIEDAHVRQSVRVLLTRCLEDESDEVRDRAALALRVMTMDTKQVDKFVGLKTRFDLAQLENQLVMYVSGDAAQFKTPFEIDGVAIVTDLNRRARKDLEPVDEAPAPKVKQEAVLQVDTSALDKIPEFGAYGKLLKSSAVVPLTESETEYVVTAVKHIYAEHLVLQYNVENTFNEVVLENVTVECQSELEEEFTVPIDRLASGETGVVFVSFLKPSTVTGTFYNILKFQSREVNPDTGEEADTAYDDDYSLESLDLTPADYMVPCYVGNFTHAWDSLGHDLGNEATSTYQLGPDVKGLSDAIPNLVDALSLMPVEGTDVAESEATHTLKMFGKTVEDQKVAAVARMVWSSKTGVAVRLRVRSDDPGLAELVAGSIA